MAKQKTNDDFFEKDYKLPDSSGYMKFVEGKNKFRVLSSPVTGYEYWTEENKPVRSPEKFTETPDIKKGTGVNHFWAMVVYNYDLDEIQILQITQKGIQKYIKENLVEDPAWGSPKEYDIVVSRKGSGLETKYTTTANPHSKLDPEIAERFEKTEIDLQSLFEAKED